MRELKFRAWDKEFNEMLPSVSLWELLQKHGALCEKENLVFMQYAGIKDCNGTEIYESDIIKFIGDNSKNISLVIFKYGSFCIETDDDFLMPIHDVANKVVIGNVYENPKILE